MEELILKIKESPEFYKSYLDEYRTTDSVLKNFLYLMKSMPVEFVPALLETFEKEQKRLEKKSVLDVVKSDDIGLLFTVCGTGKSYRFTGFHNSIPTFIELGKQDQVELDMGLEVKWIF